MSTVLPDFRLLIRPELDVALSWAQREGWNPGLRDADAFWAADPEGFYGMTVGGELVGSASIVSYGARLGFVGLFIVRPEWRGRGLGTPFWNHFIARLHARLAPGAAAALDGVFAMQSYYARSGFAFTHRNLRMEGTGRTSSPHAGLVELASWPFDDVLTFDTRHFGVPRPSFLQSWIRPEGGLGLGFVRNQKLEGIGVIRPCVRGFKIGPLFAADAEIADALFTALSSHAAGQPIYLDTPENNPAALSLAARHGLAECFGCARMVMGPIPATPWDRIFGVTTFELG